MADPFTLALQAERKRLLLIAEAATRSADLLTQMLGDTLLETEPEPLKPTAQKAPRAKRTLSSAKAGNGAYKPANGHGRALVAKEKAKPIGRPKSPASAGLQQQVLNLLEYATEPMTGPQIAAELSTQVTLASAACSRLKTANRLGHELGKGYWLIREH